MAELPLAFQDLYADDLAHCYGCGRLNQHGLHIRSFWKGERTVARFTPRPEHTAIPGSIYGGLIASLIDCHGTGSAAAAAALADGYRLGEEPVPDGLEVPRFVTASLQVHYRLPTPLGPELLLEGTIEEVKRAEQGWVRKVVVQVTLSAYDRVTAEGRVVAVRMKQP